jgi:NAD(P)-dependent dehydrogenase (short-subunit alcohol dehydrogenase family)
LHSLANHSLALLGATGALGRVLAKDLAGQGARVFALGRNPHKLHGLTPQPAGTALIDLAKPEGWAAELAKLPELDGLVVASGQLDLVPLVAASPRSFEQSIQTNFTAPALFIRELLRLGKLKPGSSLVLIGSIASHGAAGHAAYSASKAALAALGRTLALELAPRRIRVNTVSPGLIQAGMYDQIAATLDPEVLAAHAASYPLGIGKPSDISGPVAFLLSPAANWITGHDLIVDGGVTAGA